MIYRTTCLRCQSVFRITPDQLDAAQGWAQCSVCGAAFDARGTLADEYGNALPPTPSSPALAQADDAPTTPDTGADPTEVESAAHVYGIEQRQRDTELSSIILIDPDADAPDDFGPLPVFAAAAAPDTTPPAVPAPAVSRPARIAAADAPLPPASASPSQATPPATPDTTSLAAPASRARRRPRVLGGVLGLVLLAVLIAQTAYFLRDALASRYPATRPWLVDACARLGCRVSLPHDAKRIQIVGSDLQAAGNNKFNLKLTLGNRADHAQAWPVIVLTLTDDNDQAQARRSFAPSEYLPGAAMQDAGIAARSETPLTLPLAVGVKVAGYRVEVVY